MSVFSVGHARVDITPAVGVQMMGYAARTGPAVGIHDRLFAHAVALSDGEQTALIVALDLCLLGLPTIAAIKEAIRAATGIGAEGVLINTSHTHAGPLVGPWPDIPMETAYVAGMVERAAEAAAAAVADLRPATFAVSAARADIGCNRRLRKPDGTVDFGVDPTGPRLDEVTVWHFARAGAPGVVLFSLPIHGTTLSHENRLITAEWMGAAVRRLEAARPDLCGVFLLGCAGDQNPYRDEDTYDQVERHGQTVADAIQVALATEQPAAPLPLVSRAHAMQLPLAEGGTAPCPIHGLRVGGAVCLGLGGEALVEYALYGRERSRAQSTLVLGYTDGVVGYLPLAHSYPEGGYEPDANRWYPLGKPWSPALEGIIKAEVDALLEELAAS